MPKQALSYANGHENSFFFLNLSFLGSCRDCNVCTFFFFFYLRIHSFILYLNVSTPAMSTVYYTQRVLTVFSFFFFYQGFPKFASRFSKSTSTKMASEIWISLNLYLYMFIFIRFNNITNNFLCEFFFGSSGVLKKKLK